MPKVPNNKTGLTFLEDRMNKDRAEISAISTISTTTEDHSADAQAGPAASSSRTWPRGSHRAPGEPQSPRQAKRTAVTWEGGASPRGAGTPPGSIPLDTGWGAPTDKRRGLVLTPTISGALLFTRQMEVRQTPVLFGADTPLSQIKVSALYTSWKPLRERALQTQNDEAQRNRDSAKRAIVPSQSLWSLPGKRS